MHHMLTFHVHMKEERSHSTGARLAGAERKATVTHNRSTTAVSREASHFVQVQHVKTWGGGATTTQDHVVLHPPISQEHKSEAMQVVRSQAWFTDMSPWANLPEVKQSTLFSSRSVFCQPSKPLNFHYLNANAW